MPRPGRPLVVALTALALAACGSGADRSSPPVAGITAPAWPGAVTKVSVGAGPVGLTATPAGQVWVAQAQASQIGRLGEDRVDRTVASVDVPLRLAATPDALWATSFGAGQLVQIAPATGDVVRRTAVGRGAEGVTSGLGAVWVVAQDAGRLLKIDPATAQVVRQAGIEVGARLVTTGLGSVWVSQFTTGRVLKVDPRTLAVTPSAPVCQGPQGIVALAGAVWVACTTDDVAVRIDPTTLKLTARVRLPDAPDGLTAGPGGRLYVVCQAGPTVVAIDPVAARVTRQRTLGGAAQLYDQANVDIAATADAVWVSSFAENLVYRLPTG